MAPLYSMLLLYAVTSLTVLGAGTPNTPTLGSREIPHLLGNSCPKSAENIVGGDGTTKERVGWIDGPREVLEEIYVLVPVQQSVTKTPGATMIDEIYGQITPPAILNARKAEPEPAFIPSAVESLLGGRSSSSSSSSSSSPPPPPPQPPPQPTTDINSLINSAKSEASVMNAASISSLSQDFMASMQQLQNSASSAISQANASASAAISSASAQAQSALAGASAASISAASAVSLAMASATNVANSSDDRAQKQINGLKAKQEATTKITIAIIIAVIGSAIFFALGFFVISRYRAQKQRIEDHGRDNRRSDYGRRHYEHRDSYHLYDSRTERPSRAHTRPSSRRQSRSQTQSRSKFGAEPVFDKQREEFDTSEKKAPESAVYEVGGHKEYDDETASFGTQELVSFKQNRSPPEKYIDKATRTPRGSMERNENADPLRSNAIESKYPPSYIADEERRRKYITPTFVSKNNKRTSFMVEGWFGNKNKGSLDAEKIGVAS